jgi:hypothetical protein
MTSPQLGESGSSAVNFRFPMFDAIKLHPVGKGSFTWQNVSRCRLLSTMRMMLHRRHIPHKDRMVSMPRF